MEFKDRQSKFPGRIKLTKDGSNTAETYYMELADEAEELGTPLNKATFDALKEDILNASGGFAGKINDGVTGSENIYAPTVAGTKGYFLQSKGSGAPKWEFPFTFSGKKAPYTASTTITLPGIGVGKVGTDVRSCVNTDTTVTINLPSGGTYRYVYIISDPSNTSQDTTKTSVGINTNSAGGTTICTIGGSASCTTVQIIYYRAA